MSFFSSSQEKSWIFKSAESLAKNRTDKHENYLNSCIHTEDELLTFSEESTLVKYYEQRLRDFCHNFRPYINGDPAEIPLPLHTIYTACTYFKRLYLNNSCMDYHPRLSYFGCVWLALKVEEFFVEIDPFCYNAMGGKDNAHRNYQETQELGDEILAIELLLMRALNYELVVHHPFRAIEGFILDIKTINLGQINMQAVDFRPLQNKAVQLTFDSLRTDLMFLFNPSHLALAFLAIAAKEIKSTHKVLTDIFGKRSCDEEKIVDDCERSRKDAEKCKIRG